MTLSAHISDVDIVKDSEPTSLRRGHTNLLQDLENWSGWGHAARERRQHPAVKAVIAQVDASLKLNRPTP